MDLVVRSPDELLAAVPHLLGFKPAESVVVVSFDPDTPAARIDMPQHRQDVERIVATLREPYTRHAGPGTKLALVCIAEDRDLAEITSQQLADSFSRLGIGTPIRIWADESRWEDFNRHARGLRTSEAESLLAAETVALGRTQPAHSREAIATALVGDRDPIAAELPTMRSRVEQSNPSTEQNWALDRLAQFHHDGNRLSDADGTRMLVALESISTRDALWDDMTRENANSHVALWSDLTARAPDEVRAPTASMLGFASWLRGDGARAWAALDQVPEGQQDYSMAMLLAVTLDNCIHPDRWEQGKQTPDQSAGEHAGLDIDESFLPSPLSQRQDPDGPGPGPGAPPRSLGPDR